MDPSLSTLQDDEFVRRVYGLALRRDPEADVLAALLQFFAQSFTRAP